MAKITFATLIFTVMASVCAAPAVASCVFCDRIIVMNSRLAGCFQSQYKINLEAFTTSKKPFMLVDLSRCAGRKDVEKGPTVPSANRDMKAAFIMDSAGFECLKKLLDVAVDLDPMKEFDLAKECLL